MILVYSSNHQRADSRGQGFASLGAASPRRGVGRVAAHGETARVKARQSVGTYIDCYRLGQGLGGCRCRVHQRGKTRSSALGCRRCSRSRRAGVRFQERRLREDQPESHPRRDRCRGLARPHRLWPRAVDAAWAANASISEVRPSMRSSNRCQSPADSSMIRVMRGDRTLVRVLGNSRRRMSNRFQLRSPFRFQ
jgi:hypothetical protein